MKKKEIIQKLGLFMVAKKLLTMGFEVEPILEGNESNIIAKKNAKELKIKIRSLSGRNAIPPASEDFDYIFVVWDLITENPKISVLKNDESIKELYKYGDKNWIEFAGYCISIDKYTIVK